MVGAKPGDGISISVSVVSKGTRSANANMFHVAANHPTSALPDTW